MTAGMIENNAHIISLTAAASVIVMMVCPASSVPDTKPESPQNKATNEPEIAVPNFMAIVPEEKIRPVDEVPFFSVA